MPITDEEKREIVWALVKDVTVSPEDAVMITGTLTGLSVCIGEEGGSPTWTRTTNTAVNSRVLYH